MKRSVLTGLTTGEFDSLQVRSPPFTGALIDVTTLAYDDAQVSGDVAANTAAIATKANSSQVLTDVPVGAVFSDTIYDDTTVTGNVATNATAIATKADAAATTTALNLHAQLISSNTSDITHKQPLIGDNDLTISRTNGLQLLLDSKQPTVIAGSLAISATSGLQAALQANVPTYTAVQMLKQQ